MKFKIKKGDRARVITGKDKGKIGKVLKVDRKNLRITLEGINIQKHHEKAKGTSPGGIISREGAIHYSNVMLMVDNGKT